MGVVCRGLLVERAQDRTMGRAGDQDDGGNADDARCIGQNRVGAHGRTTIQPVFKQLLSCVAEIDLQNEVRGQQGADQHETGVGRQQAHLLRELALGGLQRLQAVAVTLRVPLLAGFFRAGQPLLGRGFRRRSGRSF